MGKIWSLWALYIMLSGQCHPALLTVVEGLAVCRGTCHRIVTTMSKLPPVGACWSKGTDGEILAFSTLAKQLLRFEESVCVVRSQGQMSLARRGVLRMAETPRSAAEGCPLLAWASPVHPTTLGDAGFLADHAIRWPYMAGSMANGIASVALVQALARVGMLASFGAAGLRIQEIEKALVTLQTSLEGCSFASNLIYSPNETGHEDAVVDLYLRRGLHLVEASAYLDISLPVVRYRVAGIHRASDGRIVTPNRIIAKVSRVELAQKWFSPPPRALLVALRDQGVIDEAQAELAAQIPVAQDLTAEADSGGHTDRQAAIVLLPTLLALRDRLQARHRYEPLLRVGAAGGIANPLAAAAAFSMGAGWIVTGTINQACQEAGTSDAVRTLLAEAGQADVAMAPAVDMFELGIKLQVLKRGTLFAMRGNRLWDWYQRYDSLESLPPAERKQLEQVILRMPLAEVWHEVCAFFAARDPAQLRRAESDPKHKMALVFRWYLGLSSHWANIGVPDRQADYQIWAGPAIGAFNEWCRGSYLAEVEHRRVVDLALNLLFGAALQMRINSLRQQGLCLNAEQCRIMPQRWQS